MPPVKTPTKKTDSLIQPILPHNTQAGTRNITSALSNLRMEEASPLFGEPPKVISHNQRYHPTSKSAFEFIPSTTATAAATLTHAAQCARSMYRTRGRTLGRPLVLPPLRSSPPCSCMGVFHQVLETASGVAS